MLEPRLNLKKDEDLSSILPPTDQSKLDLIDNDKMVPYNTEAPLATIEDSA